MSVISKAKDFIFQEPQNKNISPKAVVVLRISSLLFMIYLVCAGIGFGVMRRPYMVMFSVMFLILYTYVFYCAYQDKVTQACFLINVNTLIWVCMFYVIFGSGTGVQHFFFALILIDLFLVRKYPVLTILGVYAVRVGLFIHGAVNQPLASHGMLGVLNVYLYVLSMVLECAIILFAGIYFTKDAFKMESRLQKYNDELRHVASTDPLTKVWNRFRMLEHVQKCLKRYHRGELQFLSVAIGDIDFFKRVNDTYGHECGDEVLKSLAQLFDAELKGIGAVARWGGEEFLFLFENMNGDDAWTVLALIQTKMRRLEIPYEDQIIRVTMTFGLTEYDFKLSLDGNIKLADDKLYAGKDGGRDRIVY